jgi:two-component system sensor histidine kinase KdpD
VPDRSIPPITIPRLTRRTGQVVLLSLALVAIATVIVTALERGTAIPDASAVYLVAVVIVGSVAGTTAALGTAVVAFVTYDLLFTDPQFSLVVSDTSELLNLVVVLIVALAVGRLAALGRERASEADRRAAEATGLFAVSRLLATADRTEAVAGQMVELLAQNTGLERVWIGIEGGAHERILADTGTGPVPSPAVITTLVRMPGDAPAHWIRAHAAVGRVAPGGGNVSRTGADGGVIRVKVETGGSVFGSVWAVKPSGSETPDPETTRLLSLAADQIALGLRRDRLRQDATAAEVARRSDALKSALLDSVSHDLRTPLSSIRATAGNLADPAVAWEPDSVRTAAEAIDEEAQRLDRLVRSVLDLSRIESGALQPDLEVFDARELVERAVGRLRPTLADRSVSLDFAFDLPFVRVDAVLFDAIVSNVLDNVAEHTPAGTPVEIHATCAQPGRVRVTIEDGGRGVSDADLARIFDKFQRVGQPGEGARRGMGVGLSIVRGMAEAIGGAASARHAELGGLAIDLDLTAAPEPPSEARE